MNQTTYDAIIVGAGPAGCTTAALLAEEGMAVLLLEREKFPRYVVGESMLPHCYFPLERLGLLERMERFSFVCKRSVQFVGKSGRVSAPFYFSQHSDHPSSATWQVERRDFDLMMMENAREKGVTVLEEIKVMDFLHDQAGAVVGCKARDKNNETHQFHAAITVDATGRNALAAARKGWRVMDKNLKKIAIWTYFEGAKRDPGLDEGATTVAYVGNNAWFWYIPLRNNRVSVGVVGDKDYLFADSRDYAEVFAAQVRKNPWIEEHLSVGKVASEYHTIGDFSYRSQHCASDGLLLVGDAFSFLDPAFSSGLFLALHSGVLAADAILAARKAGNYQAKQFGLYGCKMAEALNNMRRLVYAFYNPDFNFALLFKKYPELKSDVTDCLIGNLHKDFGKLWQGMAEFVELPPPPEYGFPLEGTHLS